MWYKCKYIYHHIHIFISKLLLTYFLSKANIKGSGVWERANPKARGKEDFKQHYRTQPVVSEQQGCQKSRQLCLWLPQLRGEGHEKIGTAQTGTNRKDEGVGPIPDFAIGSWWGNLTDIFFSYYHGYPVCNAIRKTNMSHWSHTHTQQKSTTN